MIRAPPRSTLFPYPPLSRSHHDENAGRPPEDVGEEVVDRPAVVRSGRERALGERTGAARDAERGGDQPEPISRHVVRSEEHTSELQSRLHLVCRLLLEKKKQ